MFKNQVFITNEEGYILFSNNAKKYISNRAHIHIVYCENPEDYLLKVDTHHVDHLYGDKNDLTVEHLKQVDFSENAWNRRVNNE